MTDEMVVAQLRWLPQAAQAARTAAANLKRHTQRGTRVRVKLGAIDDIALDVHGTVAEVLADDLGGATPADAPAEDDEDDSAAAGPLTIAVDVNETEAGSADNPAP